MARTFVPHVIRPLAPNVMAVGDLEEREEQRLDAQREEERLRDFYHWQEPERWSDWESLARIRRERQRQREEEDR